MTLLRYLLELLLPSHIILQSRIRITSDSQEAKVWVRIVVTRKGDPSVDDVLCVGRIVTVAIREAPTTPGGKDDGKVTRVALEKWKVRVAGRVFSCWCRIAYLFVRYERPVRDLIAPIV